MKAMRPTPATDSQAHTLPTDPDWFVSMKIDGDRVLGVAGPTPTFLNRDGAPYTKKVPAAATALLRDLPEGFILDGEVSGTTWYLFDVVAAVPLEDRLRVLARVGELADPYHPAIEVLRHYPATDLRPTMLAIWRRSGCEGYVAKRAGSMYTGGPSTAWVKVKWVKQVDVIVVDRDRDSKANFVLGVWKDGHPGPVEVGKCSALTGDGPHIKVGDVVTVTILQVTANGRLREATLPRLRTGEVEASDCTWENMMGAIA